MLLDEQVSSASALCWLCNDGVTSPRASSVDLHRASGVTSALRSIHTPPVACALKPRFIHLLFVVVQFLVPVHDKGEGRGRWMALFG